MSRQLQLSQHVERQTLSGHVAGRNPAIRQAHATITSHPPSSLLPPSSSEPENAADPLLSNDDDNDDDDEAEQGREQSPELSGHELMTTSRPSDLTSTGNQDKKKLSLPKTTARRRGSFAFKTGMLTTLWKSTKRTADEMTDPDDVDADVNKVGRPMTLHGHESVVTGRNVSCNMMPSCPATTTHVDVYLLSF